MSGMAGVHARKSPSRSEPGIAEKTFPKSLHRRLGHRRERSFDWALHRGDFGEGAPSRCAGCGPAEQMERDGQLAVERLEAAAHRAALEVRFLLPVASQVAVHPMGQLLPNRARQDWP